MKIQHVQSGINGSFFAEAEGKTVARMTYSFENPSVMVIEHTVVDPSLRGKNIGQQLIKKAVSFAVENGVKIKPECPFVRSVFERHPEEYKDIIYRS